MNSVVFDIVETLMNLLENSFQILGIAMCMLALLPLALWTVQSLSTYQQNRIQFRNAQELMRKQILEANAHRARTLNQSAEIQPARSFPTDKEMVLRVGSPNVDDAKTINTEADSISIVRPDEKWKGFRKFKVVNLVKETSTCTSVYLEPVDRGPITNFQAGQHLPLRFEIPGQSKPVVRCYSLSNGPGNPYYRISVKAMLPTTADQAPGLVSNFINDHLEVGDLVEAKAPSGSFFVDLVDSRPIVLLAGGIGITPMISMLESLKRQAPNRIAILLYGVRNKADQAFNTYLKKAASEQESLHVINCYSSPGPTDVQGTDYQVRGFVSVDLVKKLIPNHECQFYLCGPPPFMKSLGQGLQEWGVPSDQIFSEAFGPASINKPRIVNSIPEVAGAIEVEFNQSGMTLPWSPDCESLLELAEKNGIVIDSGCRAGSCGSCTTALLAGKVDYPEGLHVDCDPGECLTCVARPLGSIKLEA